MGVSTKADDLQVLTDDPHAIGALWHLHILPRRSSAAAAGDGSDRSCVERVVSPPWCTHMFWVPQRSYSQAWSVADVRGILLY